MQVSLSKFFPKNTEYFYAFPYGQDSDFFFANDPIWKVELIAARPLICAGSRVKVITFASSKKELTWNLLRELGGPLVNPKNIIALPEEIAKVKGKKRNRMIKKALQELTNKNRLVMAQPYLGEMLLDKYKIDPSISLWCNDKKNIAEYTPEDYYPKRFVNFPSGKAFFESDFEPPLPCVVKVTSSAGGDGVRICKSPQAYARARKKFRRLRGNIYVEQFIDTKYNIGIQFGVPYDKNLPMEIIGVNEQLTTQDGEYLGAVVDLDAKIEEKEAAIQILLTHILPSIREKGWFGVGAFDVLIDKEGKCYFIDPNFRMSAMTGSLCLLQNKKIKKSFVMFTGSFPDGEAAFRERILPIAKNGKRGQKMRVLTLGEEDGVLHFNAAMFFDERKQIRGNAKFLLGLGIDSGVLKRVAKRKKIKRSID